MEHRGQLFAANWPGTARVSEPSPPCEAHANLSVTPPMAVDMTSVTGKRKANGTTKQLAEQIEHAPTDNKKTRKEPMALASQPEVPKSLLSKPQPGALDPSK